jgi:hypothetical protein
MAESIQGGSAQQLVGEGITPIAEVEVAGDDGGGAFIAFGYQVMEVLIVGRTQRFQTEVVDDEQRQPRQIQELALEGVGSPSGMQATKEL